jgi:hypothetical protein
MHHEEFAHLNIVMCMGMTTDGVWFGDWIS